MTRKDDEWTLTYTTPVKTTQFIFRLDTPFEQKGSTEKMEEVFMCDFLCVFAKFVQKILNLSQKLGKSHTKPSAGDARLK